MGRVAVTPRACMHSDTPAFFRGESREREIVQIDEAVEEIPEGIQLNCQALLGEVNLNLVRALLQTAANLGLVLAQQILDEFLARITGNPFGWIHEAQSRGRDDRLLNERMRVTHRDFQVLVSIDVVMKRPGREPKHAADVTGGERDPEP